MMKSDEIKFRFDIEFIDENELDFLFKKTHSLLNIRFDENLEPYICNDDVEYDILNVSPSNQENTQEEINSFFDFTFTEIIDKPLYKFFVLKNNNELTILANISSLIFDYASINDIYNIFNNNITVEKNILDRYNFQNSYLSSSDFEKDSKYWKKHILNIVKNVKFHNINSSNYKSIEIPLNDEITFNLKKNNISKFNFITGIFSLYLSRIDRTEGTLLKTFIPSNNVNSLLKIDFIDNYSFTDYLNEINNTYIDATEHTKISIENYLGKDLSCYSIFDFSNLDNNIIIKNGEGSALTLNIYEDYLELVYNNDLFSLIYMENMVANIESLIHNVLDNPNQIIGQINILCDDEISLISQICQGDLIDLVRDKALCNDFRKHAITNPDIIAVDDGVNQVTYGELEKFSNSVAYDLSENYGISRGMGVCIMLPRNYHFPKVVLALNKLGAFFVPLDPLYPAQRIHYMIDSSQCEVIITTREFEDLFDFNIDVIHIENLRNDFDFDVEIAARGDDLFSLMFTSGTTGYPKGVMISNKQTVGMGTAYDNVFKLNLGDRVGIFVSFSFVASYRLYCGLYLGGTCRIYNEMEQKDSILLLNDLKEKPMSDIILPPGIGIPIFENGDLKLKYMILAGAKVNELENKDSYTKVVNFYGATESIISIATIFDLNEIDGKPVPLGKPASNTWIYILDENGMQLPIGVPGEICVSSDFMSPGYYNDPELTKNYFVENPYSTCEDNKILYKTGDLGFYNFDGTIGFAGREDDQLSVRGFRIESAEILKVIKSFKEILQVVLDVDYDNLIAYYTTNGDLDVDVIKDALKRELPYYMIPSLFIELKNIPLNPHGKIDKFALKEIFKESAEIDIEDDVLSTVVELFKKVLHTDFVLIDDDFVSLGGNSLSAMKLQMLLKDKLGATIFVSEIIELSTPVNIANKIKFDLESYFDVEVKYTFEDKCPLSESQLNVYLDESVNEMGTAYNNPFIIKFNKDYSTDEIKKAIGKLLDVYPILSARILNENGVISFVFDAKPQISEGLESEIESFVRPFELDKTLSKFLLVRNDESSCLCVDVHHLISDGTSQNILLTSLISILEGDEVNFVDDGVLRHISFEENITQDYMENAREFFDLMLSDSDEVFELLPSIKTEDNGDFEYSDTFNIDEEELNSFLYNHSITPNQFFCSIFAYTLSRFTGSSKVLFNLVEDGRGHVDLSGSAGMFVRTLPMIIDCKNQDINSFLDYSRELINSVMKYDYYPFRILAKQYDLNSDILFQYSHNLFYNLSNSEEMNYTVADLTCEVIGDLSFFIFNVGDGKFGIRTLYSEKFSKEFIEHFVKTYELILKESMHANKLSDINYTLTSDLNILDSYNQTEKDLAYMDILDAFNDNLSKYPDNKLVTYNDATYSYSEGAFISNNIAENLKDIGIKSQDVVAFLVERSELYMFSALAVMSIGAVYVPIDDSYPDERIKFMLKDSNIKSIIVSDKTYERAENLIDAVVNDKNIILNISDMVKDYGILSHLPVTYGNLACILYTSGTTGIPKGVKITRKGITSYVDFYVNEYGMKNNSVFGLFASIGFDVGAIRGICAPLFGGSCLDIVPMDIRLNIDKLNKHFINHGVTHTTLPTQVAKMFIDEVKDTTLEVLITGGEKLGQINASVDYSFIDSYGPTECCVAVCAIEEKNKIDSSSIGYLFSNIKAFVLDSENRRVPIGAVGELCIAGNQVADGYLNRQKETEKSFVKNPFSDGENYTIMYRTGDLVRVLHDGSFGIVGRYDSQVKIRGNRVELTEVEAIIREIDYVENVTVQTIKQGDNNELVAYVVVNAEIDNENIQKEICEYVSKYKPDYMVPSFVINLETIPLTINGKVNKRALPEVDWSILQVEYVAPRNENERVIVEAFKKAFNKDKISIHDDFIRLGGDSLIAIKILSYLEDYDIAVTDILNLRTPADIAKNIEPINLNLDIYTVDGGCPLNEAQINLFMDVLINKTDFYHIPTYMLISKHYGLEKVLGVLDEMLKVHPIIGMHISNYYGETDKKSLSAKIHNIKDSLKELEELGNSFDDQSLVDLLRENGWNIKKIYDMIRIVLKAFKGEYPYLIKDSKPPVVVESEFNDNSIKDFFVENLDLYNYLSRFKIFELEDSYLLLAKFHHIIFDGISANIFKQDFQTLLDGGTVDIDDSFLKLAAFHKQIKDTDKFIEADNFFASMFRDIEKVEGLVGDNSSKGYSVNTYDLEFDHKILESFLDNDKYNENLLFTSVFAYTLSRFVSSDNVLFSMIDNGRGRTDDYNSIGLYATVLPLLINCKNQGIDSFLEYSSSLIYDASKYNYYPLLLLYQKYPIDSIVIFQYVPDWIEYDIIDEENNEILASEFMGSFVDGSLEDIDDLIAEFIVQIFKKDGNYSIMIVNSNKYSDEMIIEFKNSYELILSNIINANLSSDLNSLI